MTKPRRICRTPQECFEAGLEAGASLPPLTPAQVTRIAALLGPYIRASIAADAAEAEAAEDVA